VGHIAHIGIPAELIKAGVKTLCEYYEIQKLINYIRNME
jgi:hypothetical protein